MSYPTHQVPIQAPAPAKPGMHGGMVTVGILAIAAIVIGIVMIGEDIDTDQTAIGVMLASIGGIMLCLWGMTLAVIDAIRAR